MGDPKKKTGISASLLGDAADMVAPGVGDSLLGDTAALIQEGAGEPTRDYAKANPVAPENKSSWADATMPGIPGNSEASDAQRQKLAETQYIDEPYAAPKVNQHIRGEGFSTAAIGGDDIYNTTLENAPQRSMEAKADIADIQGLRSEALSGFYNEQSQRDIKAAAASKQHASEDAAALQARQQKLEEATNYYTNDLQDQGKFWQNPGNIVSAIAFSLMPIFSNDPTVGVKLINQAIDRDMANRQHAANQTLGALRSNLEGYQKIAGDRQAGDLLAQAEAHRVAAQQIQQISMSFESPIAKKQAQMAIADQLTRKGLVQMELNKMLHSNPQLMTPEMEASFTQGKDGFRRGATRVPLGGAPKPGDGSGPVPGAIQGTLGNTTIPTTSPSGKLSPKTQAVANAGGESGVSRAHGKGAIPDKEAIDAVKELIYRRAIAAHKDPNVFFNEERVTAMKQVEAVSQPMAAQAKSVSIINRLQGRMKMIEALESQDHRDPNNFVGYMRKSGMPGSETLIRQYDQIVGGDPRAAGTTKAAALDKWKADSVRSLEQELAMAINSNIHDLSGGAVNASEQGRLDKEINPNTPWRQQMNFLDAKSHALQATIDAQAMGIPSPLGQVYYRAAVRNGGRAPLGSEGISPPRPDGKTGQYVQAHPEVGPPK